MNTPVDPTLGDAALRQTELGIQQQRMDVLRRNLNNGVPQDKKAKLREACEGFEAIFIQRMWEQMQATVPKDGYLHSKDEKMWQGMYDQELSKKMAGSGGVGLADMMMQQLGKNLEDAGRKTLDTSLNRREPMPIEPAPLLAAASPEPVATPAAPAADIYSGAAPAVAESDEPEPQATPTPAAAQPGEFDSLVSHLETQMQQPEVTVTRVTTNTTTLSGPTQVRSGRGMRNPRVAPIHKNLAAQAAAASQIAPGTQPVPGAPGATGALAGVAGEAPVNAAGGAGPAAQAGPSGQPAQSAQAHTPPKHLADGESAAQMKARQDAMMRDAMIRQAMMGVQPGGGAKKSGS